MNEIEEVTISTYDRALLRELEIEAIEAIHAMPDVSSSDRLRFSLERAFQLGFSVVARGEAEGQQHPPPPENIEFLKPNVFCLGQHVTWSSQSGGINLTKVGKIVQIVRPYTLPDFDKFPGLFKGLSVGTFRDHVSYVALAIPGPGFRSKPYWPLADKLELLIKRC